MSSKKKQKHQDRPIIEITSTMLNVEYIPITDIREIKAMEHGENGWKEASIEGPVLVRCVAPIKGVVYRIRLSDCPLGEYFLKALLLHTLCRKKGRIFYGRKGVIRVAFDLPREELEHLLKQITLEVYKLAGLTHW